MSIHFSGGSSGGGSSNQRSVRTAIPDGDTPVVTVTSSDDVINIDLRAYHGDLNEIQMFQLSNQTGGTFTVSFDGNASSPIAWNVDEAGFLTGLESISVINPGDIVLQPESFSGEIFTGIEFTGAYAVSDVSLLTVNTGSLTTAGGPVGENIYTIQEAGNAVGPFSLTFEEPFSVGFECEVWVTKVNVIEDVINPDSLIGIGPGDSFWSWQLFLDSFGLNEPKGFRCVAVESDTSQFVAWDIAAIPSVAD